MVQGCSFIDEKARNNVIKDVQELDKDEQDVVKDEHDVVKDEKEVLKEKKKLVIQNKEVMGDVSWEDWHIDDMNIMEQETQVLDNTTGRALFKIQTVGKVIYISNCKIDTFSC